MINVLVANKSWLCPGQEDRWQEEALLRHTKSCPLLYGKWFHFLLDAKFVCVWNFSSIWSELKHYLELNFNCHAESKSKKANVVFLSLWICLKWHFPHISFVFDKCCLFFFPDHIPLWDPCCSPPKESNALLSWTWWCRQSLPCLLCDNVVLTCCPPQSSELVFTPYSSSSPVELQSPPLSVWSEATVQHCQQPQDEEPRVLTRSVHASQLSMRALAVIAAY